MPKCKVTNRFLVLFILLSFLLISMSVLPILIGISASNTIGVSQSEKTDNPSSFGLVIYNNLDYLATENYYYQIGSGQSFQSRKLLEDRCVTLASALPQKYSTIPYSDLPSDEIYGQLSSNKISEFLHLKDGMI